MNLYTDFRKHVFSGLTRSLFNILFFILLLHNPHISRSEEIYPVVFGFSQSILGANINVNDAKAAVKTWTTSLAKSAKIPADPKPVVFNNPQEINQALETRTADIFFITFPELYPILNTMDGSTMLIPVTGGTITEQYLLLTNKTSGIQSASQLDGKDIIIFSNSRTSIAPYWFETAMLKLGIKLHKDYFRRVTHVSKLNDAILPVFFNKAAACLVSQNGFQTLSELNPQIAKKMTTLLQSPPFVPSGLFFRKDYTSPLKDRIIADFDSWKVSPSGKQLLTIFQLDNIIIEDGKCLKNSIDLLNAYNDLKQPAPLLRWDN
jgi:ABC-type phosphate/phosphonate transport system substrate-binding protein